MPLMLRPQGEQVSLPARLVELGRARRRALVLGGVFRTAAACAFAVAVAAGLDLWLDLPAAARALLLLGTVAATGFVFLRDVAAPARKPVTPLAVAQELERRFPRFNDALASAVEFLQADDDPVHGSEYFRREAIDKAEMVLDRARPERIVPSKEAWGAFWLAMLAAVVIVPLALWFSDRSGTAAKRLFDPFGKHPWPTKTVVKFTAPAAFPHRHTAGEPLDLVVSVSGVLPSRVTVQLRNAAGSQGELDIDLEATTGTGPVDVAAQLPPDRVGKDCEIRVKANDGDTDWLPVVVVAPPKLAYRDGRPAPQLHVEFPDYTDLPPLTLPDGATVVDAVPGTRVTLRAATDRRVVSAVLRPLTDMQPLRTAASVAALAADNPFAAFANQTLADDIPADIPVRVSGPNGTHLDAEFVPRIAGLYALRFTDETGITGKQTIHLNLTPDPAPVVAMDRPAATLDPTVLLPTAAVTVVARAEDRTFAVRRLFVEYRIGGPDGAWRELTLTDFGGFAPPLGAAAGGGVAAKWAKPVAVGRAATIPVAAFLKADGTPPVEGDTLTVRAAATDWDDVTALKEPGRSREEVTIRIVDKPSLDAWLQQQLAGVRPELLKLREQQRAARDRAAEVEKAATDGKLTPDDVRKLGLADRDQRAVQQKIADPRDGLRTAADQLKETVRANNLPRSPTTDRLDAVAAELGKLADKQLDAVDGPLSGAKAEAEKPDGKPDPAAIASELKKAVKQQKAVEATLDEMLRQLEQWGGAGEMRAEARLLADQLRQADAAANKAAGKVPDGKPADQLTKPEKAELGKPAEQLNRIAERADAAVSKAGRLADEKDAQAKALEGQAEGKEKAAADAKAAGDDKAARGLKNDAADLKAAAESAKAEADALRKAVKEAANDELPKELRTAADELAKNNAGNSADARKAAAEKLEKFAQALGEAAPDATAELKRTRELGDAVDKLAAEQDTLAKKVKKAAAEPDAMKREEQLQKLAREQEKLQQKAEELAEKLTRNKNPDAAEQVREAAEKMEAAKQKLEQGMPPEQAPTEAVDKLDEALEKLDRKREDDEQKLSRDQREQVAEKLKNLAERLTAADAEAARLHADVVKGKGWDRPKLGSLGDLSDRAKGLAEELLAFSEKELEPLPVFQRLTEQASRLTKQSAKLFGERRDDAADNAANPFDEKSEVAADDRSRRPLKTALRRLQHVLSALKDDPKKDSKAAGGGGMGGDMPPGGGGMGGGGMPEQPPGLPPLAQLKALRSIQAELNERTVAFDKANPDKAKLSEADADEIVELERAQREVADLFKKLAPALQNPQGMVPQ